jgi:hypothetical protein
MVVYVDIDGTICSITNGIYTDAKPMMKRIRKINKLYAKGNTIIYWTARGTVTQTDWLELTKNQLDRWGCKYHEVRVGKPHYDLWIDDKSKEIEKV